MNKQDLLNLKNEIDTAKTKISEAKGKLSYLLTQLKDQYGCKTVKEAEEKIEEMDKRLDKLNEQIQSATTELEEKYNLE